MTATAPRVEDRRSDAPRVDGEGPFVLWFLAIVATLASLMTRSIEPALPGVWVGVDHVITAVKLAGAISSQLFAVASTAVVIGLVLATLRSGLPPYLRAFSVGTGLLTILAVMVASAVRLPHVSRLVVAVSAAILVLLVVRLSSRIYTLRAVSLVLACMAGSALIRVTSIVLAGYATQAAGAITVATRVMATLSSVVELCGVAVALAWLITSTSSRKRARYVAVATVMIVGALLLFVDYLGKDPEAGGATLLLARALERLHTNPQPYTPDPIRAYLELVRWLLVVTIVVLRPRGLMLAAAVAFALVARGNLEVPLCAMSLVIGALTLGLHPGPDLRVDPPPKRGPPSDLVRGRENLGD